MATTAFVLIATSLFLMGIDRANAESELRDKSCPAEWSDVVDRIHIARSTSADIEVPKVLFVGQNGVVFNCLAENISAEELALIEVFERAKAKTFGGREADYPDALPYNFCNIGRSLGIKTS